jgi:hypothetical protein
MIKKILVASLMAFAFSGVQAADVPVAKLYKSYEKNGQSTSDMPEFGKSVTVTGVVLGHRSSLSDDGVIVSLGGSRNGEELARATFASDASVAKAQSLKVGGAFKAQCKLGFSMGSDYLPLESCEIK